MKHLFFFMVSIYTCTAIIYSQKINKIMNQSVLDNQTSVEHEIKGGFMPATDGMKYFEPQDYYPGYLAALSVTLAANNELFMFWVKEDNDSSLYNIYLSKSSNSGATWYFTSHLHSVSFTLGNYFNITSVVTSSERIMLVYNQHTFSSVGSFYKIYSDNNGITWSSPQLVLTGFGSTGKNPSLTKAANGNIWLVYNRSDNSIRLRTSNDNGITWSSEKTFSSSVTVYSGTLVSLQNQKIGIIYGSNETSGHKINLRTSTDEGTTWSLPIVLLESNIELSSIAAVKSVSGSIYVAYEQSIKKVYNLPNKLVNYPQVYEHVQNDVYLIKSTDNGISWTTPESFTNYFGFDGNCSIGMSAANPIIFFQSNRSYSNNTLWYGVAEITIDSIFPPTIAVLSHVNSISNLPVIINSLILNNIGIQSVVLDVQINGVYTSQINLYDDGLHNDGVPNDKIWGNSIGPFNPLDEVKYQVTVLDSAGHQVYKWGTIFNSIDYLTQGYVVNVNKLKVSVLNNGVTADAREILPESGGWFEESTFLFSGGFLLSGYSNDSLWINGQATSSRIEDYLPGSQGILPNPTNTKIFVVKESDIAFGQSWQEWSEAVLLGADFYDGNGDSIYLPVDLNSNGQWDANEDRPGLVGDETIFCVYNDRVPSNLRRYSNVTPKEIEIRQTVYAFRTSEYKLDHALFVKYEIANKSQHPMDSIFFSAFSDADIGGDYTTDLFGSDTASASGFTYKKVSDINYGSNPPAYFLGLLQGPAVFIPGETFIDINSNGIYDPGIDTPLDSAFNVRGPYLSIDTIPGAKNLQLTSSVHYMSSHPTMGDPGNIYQARTLQLGGMSMLGQIIDPCNWPFGTVLGGVDCNTLNSKFMYSGNPETNFGWLNNTEIDQLQLANVGPFSLKQNQSAVIIVTYSVGRGSSGVNSVTKGKENIQQIVEAFKNNFPVLVDVHNESDINISSFQLYQNYPNPFNPTTKIKFTIPSASSPLLGGVRGGFVTLKVYDVLGKEIVTIINEEKPAGIYETEFSAKWGQESGYQNLASGIYFYQLKARGFTETRKMVLLR